MYHFMARWAPEPLELSEIIQIPGHIRQYLRDFQVDTLRFLHKQLLNSNFCILNDESGLGKCVSTAVYLGAIAKNKNALIVVQNDDELVTGWQFHFEVLTNLSVGVLETNTSLLDPFPNILIAKWGTLRTNIDASKYHFDYVIIDNRGEIMNNNFCMSMLLSSYEHKVNLLISSIDVASDLKLLHNALRLGGRLEHQYEKFKNFEAKYKLPNCKDVLNKTADLEQYFLKREMISDYCKDFRLRRYRHQYEDQLPLVDLERYKISLELWRTISSSNSSQRSNDNTNNLNPNSETATEELFNQALALDREVSQIIESRQGLGVNIENNESSDDAIIMSPLLIDSESCSSDEPQVISVTNQEGSLNQIKPMEPDIYEFVDLSMEQNSDEYVSNAKQNAKRDEGISISRSLTQTNHNEKTSDTKKADNVENLVVSQVIDKKTERFDNSKEISEKKTNEEQEVAIKHINNISKMCGNKIIIAKKKLDVKKQTETKCQKQDEFSEKQKLVTPVADSNKMVTVIATRLRTSNQCEKISEGSLKKLKSPAKENDLSANGTDDAAKEKSKITLRKSVDKCAKPNIPKADETKDLSKEKSETNKIKRKSVEIDESRDKANNASPKKSKDSPKEKSKLNKHKSDDISISFSNENNLSPGKRPVLKDTDLGLNETENKKARTESREVKLKKQVIVQAKEGEPESSPSRKIKQGGDKCDACKEKIQESCNKSSCSATKSSAATPTKKGNVSHNANPSSIEKGPKRDSPKNKTRLEIAQTPTLRNTRSMQRITRSADNLKSKYMRSTLFLEDSPRQKRKNKPHRREDDNSKSLDAEKKIANKKNEGIDTPISKRLGGKKDDSPYKEEANVYKKGQASINVKCDKSIRENNSTQNQTVTTNKRKCAATSKTNTDLTDLSILPSSQNTDDMQCGQKIIPDTHSDNGFLRPPTPIRFIRNSENKIFVSTPSSIAESEVVFLPPSDANKVLQVVLLSSSTEDGSLSSQQSLQSRRTRALKQKKSIKQPESDRLERINTGTTATPTFGELLAKQQTQLKSPDIFSASTELGLTCTQQQPVAVENNDTDIFQGFKIFGSEVKQIQQQHAHKLNGKRSTQTLSRGRSCLNILEKMFDSNGTDDRNDKTTEQEPIKSKQNCKKNPDNKLVKRTKKCNQPVVPTLPNVSTAKQAQLPLAQEKHNKSKEKLNNISMINDPMIDEEIFEITNNDAFGSVMRINSNGEISPVQATSIRSQQQSQHNKITNYLIGSTQLTPTEATLEERTPSKRVQMQLSGTVTRRSPKSRLTQTTKLTKWFQKHDGTSLNDNQSIAEQDDIRMTKYTRSAMARRLKRRRLELSFKN